MGIRISRGIEVLAVVVEFILILLWFQLPEYTNICAIVTVIITIIIIAFFWLRR